MATRVGLKGNSDGIVKAFSQKNNKAFTRKIATQLHMISLKQGLYPVKTGYLRDSSVRIKEHGLTSTMVTYDTTGNPESENEYSGLVWPKNKTGTSKWLLKAWRENKKEIVHEALQDLFKGESGLKGW